MGNEAAKPATSKPATPAKAAAPKYRQRYTVGPTTHPHDAERLFNLGMLDDGQIAELCQRGILVPPPDKMEALRARGVQVAPVKVDDPAVIGGMEPVPQE